MSDDTRQRSAAEAAACASDPVVEYLDWDSRFFGRRIARARDTRLTAESARALMDACVAQRIDCLYVLAEGGDAVTVRLLEQHGCAMVDVRVTMERRGTRPAIDAPPSGIAVRDVRPEDVPHLKAMARTGFGVTRFYADPRFPVSSVDALYETWIEKSCRGYADAVMVAEVGGRMAGYASCHLRGGGLGQIGLLGVRDEFRGRGLGRTLANAAAAWCASRGADRVRVVTQGRNAGALKVYQRCGFTVEAIDLWYHRWWMKEGGRGHD